MNIRLKAFQLLLFLCPMCLCILLLLSPDNLYEEAAASTVTPSGHTSFSQSYCLTDNIMISADITPIYNAHYYYIELAEPSSVILNFTHDSQGHFDFCFYSLNENTKYTAAADKSSYNWKIKNLSAGRYYLTVSCTFSTCTQEQYTLLYSRHALAQAASTPAAPNSDTGSSSEDNSAADNFSSTPPAAGGNASSSDAKSTSQTSIDNMEDDEKIQVSAIQEEHKKKQTNAKTKKSKNKKILIRSLQLKNKKKELYINSSLQLKTDIRPRTATNQSLRFRSSDNRIAHVSKKGTVRALKKGTVDITVKSVDGSRLYATYTLKIKERKISGTDKNTSDASPPTTEKTAEAAPTAAASIRLSNTSITLHVKKTSHIKASVFPSNADDKKLCWKILNPKTASVHNGKVTAKSPGITTIIVSLKSNPSIRASCTITVK